MSSGFLRIIWIYTITTIVYNSYKAMFSYNKLLNIVENHDVLVCLVKPERKILSQKCEVCLPHNLQPSRSIFTVPERESFALLVIHAFKKADALLACNILQWICSMEHHIPVIS
jgi:hypothetical protein